MEAVIAGELPYAQNGLSRHDVIAGKLHVRAKSQVPQPCHPNPLPGPTLHSKVKYLQQCREGRWKKMAELLQLGRIRSLPHREPRVEDHTGSFIYGFRGAWVRQPLRAQGTVGSQLFFKGAPTRLGIVGPR